MFNRSSIFLALLLQTFTIKAKEQQTIPFIYQQTIPAILNGESSRDSSSMQDNISQSERTISEKITDIPTDELKKIIKLFKTEMCDVNQNGSFKLVLSVDAGGKIIGIGISAMGGLEVNITCNGNGAKNK